MNVWGVVHMPDSRISSKGCQKQEGKKWNQISDLIGGKMEQSMLEMGKRQKAKWIKWWTQLVRVKEGKISRERVLPQDEEMGTGTGREVYPDQEKGRDENRGKGNGQKWGVILLSSQDLEKEEMFQIKEKINLVIQWASDVSKRTDFTDAVYRAREKKKCLKRDRWNKQEAMGSNRGSNPSVINA